MSEARYAIYYAPDALSQLTLAAESWLGHSASRNTSVDQPNFDGLPKRTLCDLTAQPRRYGFHATLKAPFRLAQDRREADLSEAILRFAGRQEVADIDILTLRWIGSFLALVPAVQSQALQDLAMDVVWHLDAFRAPLNARERARRMQADLSEHQAALLDRWGYPYVDDEFRFHMTLTGRVDPDQKEAVEAAARQHFADFLDRPLAIDRLALFKQAAPEQFFVAIRGFPLSRSAATNDHSQSLTTVDS
ncbi:MAG: DUF1045 domain-containing protein [Pseudomonadota bacterium]